jgi:hypothetical protein
MVILLFLLILLLQQQQTHSLFSFYRGVSQKDLFLLIPPVLFIDLSGK